MSAVRVRHRLPVFKSLKIGSAGRSIAFSRRETICELMAVDEKIIPYTKSFYAECRRKYYHRKNLTWNFLCDFRPQKKRFVLSPRCARSRLARRDADGPA